MQHFPLPVKTNTEKNESSRVTIFTPPSKPRLGVLAFVLYTSIADILPRILNVKPLPTVVSLELLYVKSYYCLIIIPCTPRPLGRE